jgi:hypothetical protein
MISSAFFGAIMAMYGTENIEVYNLSYKSKIKVQLYKEDETPKSEF